ncbi:MAG: MBL fold metallo-hydrolase [Planctomycetes bacterium]|nr:MBL fold metallo-hydrolase [Planctomycetota bacterium]
MILKQYYLGCLSHASYLIGDEETRTAAIVDPQRDVQQYLDEAKLRGLEIRHVILTHFHADFVAGHIELARATGATIHLGARATAQYPFHAWKEGEPLQFGKVRLDALETPGHTPEGLSIVVRDLAKENGRPQAVLTGDTLFVGDVGRPDLMASIGITAEELAGMLYDSLHEKLLKLPDDVMVYPAHGAGSMCGKNLSSDTYSTIGAQRATNLMLQPMTKAQFAQLATTDQPAAPAYFAFDAQKNREQRSTLDETLKQSLKPLALDDVLAAQAKGALVLDVREPGAFETGHLAGSLNIGLSGKFATWAGFLIDPTREVVLVADLLRENEAALRLGRVGFDRVVGFLRGGPAAFAARPELLRKIERIEPAAMKERVATKEREVVLDVRGAGEWNDGHIEGSVNVPLPELERRIAEVPRGKRIALHCQSGYRSSIASGILERHGITGFTDLVGGIAAWRAAGLPTVSTTTARS